MSDWKNYHWYDGPETIESLRAQRDDARRQVVNFVALVDEIREIVKAPADVPTVEAVKRALASSASTGIAAEPPIFTEEPAGRMAAVPKEVHENGWQWRPIGDDALAPPFGTIRVCRVCGCLVAGGPTACGRCVAAEEAKPG